VQSPPSWHDLGVVITGAAGFLGSACIADLTARGSTVIAIDPRANTTAMNACGAQKAYWIPDDLSEAGTALGKVMASHEGLQWVMLHFAGWSHAGRCEHAPQDAYAANVGLVEDALNIAKTHGIQRFLLPSTGLVYAADETSPYFEDSATAPRNVYAKTKLEAEERVRRWTEQGWGTGCAIRISNVYGPSASEETVLGRLLTQARSNEAIRLFTFAPVRDFVHISDVAEGFARLATLDMKTPFATVNLSTGHGTSIRQLVKWVAEARGIPVDRLIEEKPTQVASDSLVLSNQTLGTLVGWAPQPIGQSQLTALI
jgi:UDP-glucose 4-epimerase